MNKPPNCNILDPSVPVQGFITADGYAAVPYGNQLIVIYNGSQLKVCRTEQSARNYIKKHKPVKVSNQQSSPIVQTQHHTMKKKLYRKCVDKMSTTYLNRNRILHTMGDSVSANSIYDEWVVDGIDPEESDYDFLFLPDLTKA